MLTICPGCGDEMEDGTSHVLCTQGVTPPPLNGGKKPDTSAFQCLAGDPVYRTPIIGPFIAPGDLFYFVGQDGCGKSRMVADVLVHANDPAQDSPAPLGGAFTINRELYDPLQGHRTLIVDGENSIDEWRRHLGHVMDGYKIPKDHRAAITASIFYVDASEFGLGSPYRDKVNHNVMSRGKQCLDLARLAAAGDYRIVVMDPIWDCFAPESVADDQWVTHGLSIYHREAQKLGITTLVVAHPPLFDPKGGPRQRCKPFGTTRQLGCMDGRFLVEHNKDRTGIRLSIIKDRTAYWIRRESHVTLYFNAKIGGGYERVTNLNQWPHTPNVTLTDDAKAVLSHIPEGRAVKSDELVELCGKGNIARKRLDIILATQLIPSRIVVRTGTGKRGDPYFYRRETPTAKESS